MNRNVNFIRKVVYLGVIVALLAPIYWLGIPRFGDKSGGVLARMRTENKLSRTDLGKVDPVGEAMQLAMLGLDGTAANLLWNKALYYKKTEQWDQFRATLEQINKLQPNFVDAWCFRAWDLSFNTSVEFDDYRYRYHWVKEGIDYLIEGTEYNHDQPLILWNLGWFFSQKIGRADEQKEYRRMFRNDTAFHDELRKNPLIDIDDPINGGLDYKGQYDSWLVSRLWFLEGQEAVDTKGMPVRGTSPTVFHSQPVLSYISYCEAIEKEGQFGTPAQDAWSRAADFWNRYGDRVLITGYGVPIRLNDYEKMVEQADEMETRLDALLPGVREELKAARREALGSAEKKALETPVEQRTADQHRMAEEAERAIEVAPTDVAREAPDHLREEAARLALDIELARHKAQLIGRYRDTANYIYWRTRCLAEREEISVAARRNIYEANRLFDQADLERAREAYERGWDNWDQVFQKYPLLLEAVTARDLLDDVYRYRDLLDQLGETFPPPDFKLLKLLEYHDEQYATQAWLREGPFFNQDSSQTPPAEEDKPAETPEAE